MQVFALVCAATLPLLALGSYGLWRASMDERERAAALLLDQTRSLAMQIDGEFARAEVALRTLSSSRTLAQGDLAGWQAEVRSAQTALRGHSNAVPVIDATDAGNGPALNGAKPESSRSPAALQALGTPGTLHWTDHLAATDAAQALGEVHLYLAAASGERLLRLRWPSQRFGEVLLRHPFTGDRVAAVLDRRGILVTRTRRAPELVGKPATPPVLAALARQSEGVLHPVVNQDGHASVVAFARAPQSGFAVVTAVPLKEFSAALRADLTRNLAAGAIVLVFALGAGWWGARRLAQALDRVGQSSPQGEALPTGLRETDALSQRLAQAARERDAAMQAKDRFLAMVSHELRSPLAAILGWCRVLERAPQAQPELQERALKAIARSALTQARLVDDLLDLTRIGSSKLKLDRHLLSLREVVDAAVDAALPSAQAAGVQIRRLPPTLPGGEGPCEVLGDAARLEQVVGNLLGNAIKFSRPGGEVRVSLNAQDDAACLQVSDDGAGIDPAFLPHLFEPFRQDEQAHVHHRQGLGLGLAIAHHIVVQHGGRLQARSAGREQGASFELSLPRVGEPPRPISA